jgi:transcriptional regulator with XRE-family HTH domain
MSSATRAHLAHVTASYIWRLESGGAAPRIDPLDHLAAGLGTTAPDLLPTSEAPDDLAVLKERARRLFETLYRKGQRGTFLLLNPLMARLLARQFIPGVPGFLRTCARRSDDTDARSGVASGPVAAGSALILPHFVRC